MRESPEQVAKRLAEKAAVAVPPDVLEHPMPYPARLDYAAKQIRRTIPLDLYEELRQVAESFQLPIWSCCPDGQHSPNIPSCIPGNQMKHVLKQLETFLKT